MLFAGAEKISALAVNNLENAAVTEPDSPIEIPAAQLDGFNPAAVTLCSETTGSFALWYNEKKYI